MDIEEINFGNLFFIVAWLKLGWELGYYVGRVRFPRLQKISLSTQSITQRTTTLEQWVRSILQIPNCRM